MNYTVTQDTGPDFSKFKNIPPAFAGAIIDWSMGSREITATIIDLVLRDYLSVIDSKVIRNRKSKPLKNFESKFIKTIFGKSESLTFDQFSQIAFKKEFNNLLRIISDGMMEEGFVDKNFQEKFTKAAKQSMTEMAGVNLYKDIPTDIDTSKNPKIIVIKSWTVKICIIVVGIAWIVSYFIPYMSFLTPFLLGIFLLSLITYIWTKRIAKKITKKLGEGYDWMLTPKGQSAKSNSLDLKRYMETYPVIEDRLANELVSFAIAFGLGKVWMKKIGKFNANLNVFLESMNSQGDTLIQFLDLPKYIASFETKQESG